MQRASGSEAFTIKTKRVLNSVLQAARALRGSAASRAGASVGSGDMIGPGAAPARVRRVQELVNRATTHKVVVDGVYGPATITGVKFLQRRLQLPPTGLADALTLVLGQARIEAQIRQGEQERRFRLTLPTPPHARWPQHPFRPELRIAAPGRLFIPRKLEREGLNGYEPETLACFLAALGGREGTVFDIGANVGVFAWLAAALTDWTVIAFEPMPDLADVASAVASANSLRIKVEELALGAETGTATLHLSNVTDASHSLAAGFRQSSAALDVPVERLDDYCARTGNVPAVLKIDTETTEPDVLRGGIRLLRDARPLVVCEVLPGYREGELASLLEPLAYTWYPIRDALPLQPSRELHGDPDLKGRNWLFAPAPPDDDFWKRMKHWRERLQVCNAPAHPDDGGH
jgi:FkbM family methyltransferase